MNHTNPITTEHVRAAGGIVHSDGNVFFTSIDKLNEAARAALAAQPVAPEGWKLVPVEPTDAMIEAGYDAENNDGKTYLRPAWRYMLAVAPSPEATEVREDGQPVPVRRWEIGIRRIVALLWGNRHEFEVDDVVEAVRKLIPEPKDDDEGLVRAVLAPEASKPEQAETPEKGKLKVTLQDTECDRYRRMFEAACVALGQVSEALGLDPEDGGADPILAAIEDLKASVHDAKESATHPPAASEQAGAANFIDLFAWASQWSRQQGKELPQFTPDLLGHLTAKVNLALQKNGTAADREVAMLRDDVQRVAGDGDGFWRPCSGCYESNEGYLVGPNSMVFGCGLGNGCSECGGLGAIWDTTDYDAMADAMAKEPKARDLSDSDMDQITTWVGDLESGDLGFHGFCDKVMSLATPSPASPAGEREVLVQAHKQIRHLVEDLTRIEDGTTDLRVVNKPKSLMFSNCIAALERLEPQLRAALATQPLAEQKPVGRDQPCGHPASLLLTSAETGAPLYCEACDDKSGRRDAEARESELMAANRALLSELADLKKQAVRRAEITSEEWEWLKHPQSAADLAEFAREYAERCAFRQTEPVEPFGFMNAGHVHELQQKRAPYGYVYPEEAAGAHVSVYTSPQPEQVALPENETPAMHDAVMQVLYQGGATRTRTNELWQAYRGALISAQPEQVAQDIDGIPTSWELSWGELTDDAECGPIGWRVHDRCGSRNDREWVLVGIGDTPSDAIRAARARGQEGAK